MSARAVCALSRPLCWRRINKQTNWVSCISCWRKYYSVTSKGKQKPFYATTPIFYVNASPHLGHLHSLVLTDCIVRYQKAKGRRAMLCTGTDEHGLKIWKAAELAGLDPMAFCDEKSEKFRALGPLYNVSVDRFVRTTEPTHKEAVWHLWKNLNDKGYIYKGYHEGWYSVDDETFYPESSIDKKTDDDGNTIFVSRESGSVLEWSSEENYQFRLVEFKERLLDIYRNRGMIMPDVYRAQVIKHIETSMRDLSISRPRSRLPWGIPVPGDEKHTIYVWLDALVNYATKANYPWDDLSQMTEGGWPPDAHIIGKDIVRFHAIYWPAFLMAAGLPLPKHLVVHAHWTLNSTKMSKSRGNVVDPVTLHDTYGSDIVRYFLMREGRLSEDSNFTPESLRIVYERDLKSQLGNLLQRISARRIVEKPRQVIQEVCESSIDDYDEFCQDIIQDLFSLSATIESNMECYETFKVLENITILVAKANRFIQAKQPWSLAKSLRSAKSYTESFPDVADSDFAAIQTELNQTIFVIYEVLRIVGIHLQPYMPSKAAELLDRLGVSEDRRLIEFATFARDKDYGGTEYVKETLFPALAVG